MKSCSSKKQSDIFSLDPDIISSDEADISDDELRDELTKQYIIMNRETAHKSKVLQKKMEQVSKAFSKMSNRLAVNMRKIDYFTSKTNKFDDDQEKPSLKSLFTGKGSKFGQHIRNKYFGHLLQGDLLKRLNTVKNTGLFGIK